MPPRQLILAIFAVGVLALVIAVAGPSILDPVINDSDQTLSVTGGEDYVLTDTLNVSVTDIEQGASTANATFTNLRTRNTSSTGAVAEGNSTTVTLDGDQITFEVDDITGSNTAVTTAVYPPLFGWADGPRRFMENLDIIIMILIGAIVIGMAVIMVKEV